MVLLRCLTAPTIAVACPLPDAGGDPADHVHHIFARVQLRAKHAQRLDAGRQQRRHHVGRARPAGRRGLGWRSHALRRLARARRALRNPKPETRNPKPETLKPAACQGAQHPTWHSETRQGGGASCRLWRAARVDGSCAQVRSEPDTVPNQVRAEPDAGLLSGSQQRQLLQFPAADHADYREVLRRAVRQRVGAAPLRLRAVAVCSPPWRRRRRRQRSAARAERLRQQRGCFRRQRRAASVRLVPGGAQTVHPLCIRSVSALHPLTARHLARFQSTAWRTRPGLFNGPAPSSSAKVPHRSAAKP